MWSSQQRKPERFLDFGTKLQNDSRCVEMADQSKYLYLFSGLPFYYLSLFHVNEQRHHAMQLAIFF